MFERRPIAVDLFAGVGGMSLGFEQAGFDIVAAVEHDAAHAAAHRFNFPQCSVLQGDAMTLAADDIVRAVRGRTVGPRTRGAEPAADRRPVRWAAVPGIFSRRTFGLWRTRGIAWWRDLYNSSSSCSREHSYSRTCQQWRVACYHGARLQCRSGSKAAWASAATSCRMRKYSTQAGTAFRRTGAGY